MNYQKMIDDLTNSGWTIDTYFKKNGVESVLCHNSWKQSYIQLPSFFGKTIEETMEKIEVYFNVKAINKDLNGEENG